VSKFYGRAGKIEGGLEPTKGVLNWPKGLVKSAGIYCANDVDECFAIFSEMLPNMPVDEIDLIDLTVRMFTDPVLKVDIPRVEIELAREIKHRKDLMTSIVKLIDQDDPALIKSLSKAERALVGEDKDLLIVKKVVGSNERFAALLRAQGVQPPMKISPAWIKKPIDERDDADKLTYAFAKDDAKFINLPETPEEWTTDLDMNKKSSVMQMAVRAAIIKRLVDTRLAVKSTTNITRAERFLKAGAGGMPLPCGYAYFRAHTGRWGGNNKMNMQNLTRGGELRQSILAPKGHQLAVVDSGQIEARTNGWLWGQDDLLAAFAAADQGIGRDAYCLMGDVIYGRTITKADETERFVGKVAVLGLGFQMGAPKLQMTLAKGALGGKPVFFTLKQCEKIVMAYRRKNFRIEAGWGVCKRIIDDMAAGRTGSHKCISWAKEVIFLPNGMTLKYPDLKKAMGDKGWEEWSYQSGAIRKKIYGGLLCENIVQALARIIVGWQMLQISRKHRIVMTTHDEAVACIKDAQASSAFTFMLKTMRTAPAWCADIPLNAEGGHAINYSK
jgi:DNA polymerase